MPQFRISEAAELLGVSDDTVRRWIDTGRLAADADYSGRQVVDGAALAAVAVHQSKVAADDRGAQVSARNRFVGLVTAVRIEGLVAQVEVQAGSSHFVSLITADSARSLDLQVGAKVVVSIKATSVGVELSE